MKATISNPVVLIKPSKELILHIHNLKKYQDMPSVFINICLNSYKHSRNPVPVKYVSLITQEDRSFIEALDLHPAACTKQTDDPSSEFKKGVLLSINDLLWLWNKLQEERQNNAAEKPPYLHELLMGSSIILPPNKEIPRNEQLDKRCNMLKRQQENREYKAMTKYIDSIRKALPEDSVSYQLKQINKQLIAVAQFIISVVAGFAFGFIGIQFMIGTLDFGFRLLLGVIFSLTIALAELYFLAKKLNEDLQYEAEVESKAGHSKID